MNASDDTKFERARRERPHIEAFARLRQVDEVEDVEESRPAAAVDMREVLARWSAVDELADPRNDESPPAPGR